MSFFDNVSGRPCNNCEDEPTAPGDLFCSAECRHEYEGTGEYADA